MFEGLKTASEGITTLIKMKDKIETMRDVMPLLEAINTAQADATKALSIIHDLTIKNQELEKEIVSFRNAEKRRDDYELHIFPETGAIAYAGRMG